MARFPLLSRVLGRLSPSSKALPLSYGAFTSAATSLNIGDPDQLGEGYDRLQRKYGRIVWVYVACNRIANANAQIPFHLIRSQREGKPDAIIDGPAGGLRKLLTSPNPFQSWFDLIEETSLSMELTGNAYIVKDRLDGYGRPHELWVLDASKVRIVADLDAKVKGYAYYINGKEIDFAPEEIIHIKYGHPYNQFYGLSPLQVAKLACETDLDSQQWNQNFLRKGAWPAGAVECDNDIEPETERRIKHEIRKVAARGKDSVGQILLLAGGLKYKAIALGPKEVDWLAGRHLSRDEIFAVYGVPFSVAGMYSNESTTARSAGVAQQTVNFYIFTVFPKRAKIMNALNRDLVSLFPGDLKLIDDSRNIPALKDDVAKELIRSQTFRTLTSSGWSIEMALAELYPHVPAPAWGNVAWMNQAMIPISGPKNDVVDTQLQQAADLAQAQSDAAAAANNPTDPASPAEGDPAKQKPSTSASPKKELLPGERYAKQLGFDDETAPLVADLFERYEESSEST